MSTSLPDKIIIQQHDDQPDSFSLVLHLRVEFSIGRQFNLGPMPEAELLQRLEEWVDDREGFLERHFGWRAADIDRRIRSHGNAGRGSKAAPLGHITLADLGL